MIAFEWWLWLVIGAAIGIYVENIRRQGRRVIPWELRYWFSENWPALAVYTPIIVGLAGVIGVFTFSFLSLDFAATISFIIVLCDSPILFLYMWLSRGKKTKGQVDQ